MNLSIFCVPFNLNHYQSSCHEKSFANENTSESEASVVYVANKENVSRISYTILKTVELDDTGFSQHQQSEGIFKNSVITLYLE